MNSACTAKPALESVLPAEPTWSVRALLNPDKKPDPLSEAGLERLYNLAGLEPPKDGAERQQALEDIQELMVMVDVVKDVNTRGLRETVNVVNDLFEKEGEGIF